MNLTYRVKDEKLENTPWEVLFSTAAWWLWKWRNRISFKRILILFFCPISMISNSASEFWYSSIILSNASLLKCKREDRWVRWIPPIKGWLKLNCDGALNSLSGKACGGGLFRDHDGRWRMGFVRQFQCKHSWEVELLSLIKECPLPS